MSLHGKKTQEFQIRVISNSVTRFFVFGFPKSGFPLRSNRFVQVGKLSIK